MSVSTATATARVALRRQSALLQPTRSRLGLQQLRQASTTSEAASAASQGATQAKAVASSAASRASAGLTRVTASATSAIQKAAPAIAGNLGKIGGRTGRLISFVQTLIPPAVYYSRVTAELAKAIFHGQKMYPPTTAQFQQYLQPLLNLVRNPSSFFQAYPALRNPQQLISQARGLSSQQLTGLAIIAAEVLGFFTVGEMIGRLKLVGYRGKVEHH